MATCSLCQFPLPEATETCPQCAARDAGALERETVARDMAQTPLPGENLTEAPAEPSPPQTRPNLRGAVADANPPSSTLTVCNRAGTSRLAEEPAEGAAVSVLEGGLTRVSSRAAPRGGSTTKVSAPEAELPPAPPAPMTTVQPAIDAPAPPGQTPPPSPPTLAPRLIVLRGEHLKAVYPIYAGKNVVGRFADRPVDIDLEGQEPIERIRISRHHAIIHFDAARNELRVEDLNSLNGTWVNGTKVYSGQPRRLAANDVLQVGTVQMKLVVEAAE